MLKGLFRRLLYGSDEKIAAEYGTMSDEDRLALEREQEMVNAPGVDDAGIGRSFDRELDAEEGRPGA